MTRPNLISRLTSFFHPQQSQRRRRVLPPDSPLSDRSEHSQDDDVPQPEAPKPVASSYQRKTDVKDTREAGTEKVDVKPPIETKPSQRASGKGSKAANANLPQGAITKKSTRRSSTRLPSPAPSARTTSAIVGRTPIVTAHRIDTANMVTLRAMCRSHKLSTAGNLSQLRDRLHRNLGPTQDDDTHRLQSPQRRLLDAASHRNSVHITTTTTQHPSAAQPPPQPANRFSQPPPLHGEPSVHAKSDVPQQKANSNRVTSDLEATWKKLMSGDAELTNDEYQAALAIIQARTPSATRQQPRPSSAHHPPPAAPFPRPKPVQVPISAARVSLNAFPQLDIPAVSSPNMPQDPMLPNTPGFTSSSAVATPARTRETPPPIGAIDPVSNNHTFGGDHARTPRPVSMPVLPHQTPDQDVQLSNSPLPHAFSGAYGGPSSANIREVEAKGRSDAMGVGQGKAAPQNPDVVSGERVDNTRRAERPQSVAIPKGWATPNEIIRRYNRRDKEEGVDPLCEYYLRLSRAHRSKQQPFSSTKAPIPVSGSISKPKSALRSKKTKQVSKNSERQQLISDATAMISRKSETPVLSSTAGRLIDLRGNPQFRRSLPPNAGVRAYYRPESLKKPPLSETGREILASLRRVRDENRGPPSGKRPLSPLPFPPSVIRKRARMSGSFSADILEDGPTKENEPVHNTEKDNLREKDRPFVAHGCGRRRSEKVPIQLGNRNEVINAAAASEDKAQNEKKDPSNETEPEVFPVSAAPASTKLSGESDKEGQGTPNEKPFSKAVDTPFKFPSGVSSSLFAANPPKKERRAANESHSAPKSFDFSVPSFKTTDAKPSESAFSVPSAETASFPLSTFTSSNPFVSAQASISKPLGLSASKSPGEEEKSKKRPFSFGETPLVDSKAPFSRHEEASSKPVEASIPNPTPNFGSSGFVTSADAGKGFSVKRALTANEESQQPGKKLNVSNTFNFNAASDTPKDKNEDLAKLPDRSAFNSLPPTTNPVLSSAATKSTSQEETTDIPSASGTGKPLEKEGDENLVAPDQFSLGSSAPQTNSATTPFGGFLTSDPKAASDSNFGETGPDNSKPFVMGKSLTNKSSDVSAGAPVSQEDGGKDGNISLLTQSASETADLSKKEQPVAPAAPSVSFGDKTFNLFQQPSSETNIQSTPATKPAVVEQEKEQVALASPDGMAFTPPAALSNKPKPASPSVPVSHDNPFGLSQPESANPFGLSSFPATTPKASGFKFGSSGSTLLPAKNSGPFGEPQFNTPAPKVSGAFTFGQQKDVENNESSATPNPFAPQSSSASQAAAPFGGSGVFSSGLSAGLNTDGFGSTTNAFNSNSNSNTNNGAQASSASAFGSTPFNANSFGFSGANGPSASSSAFGSGGAFGSTSFGFGASSSSMMGFQQTPSNVFGGSSGSNQNPFGSSSGAGVFGNNGTPASSSGGMFGATPNNNGNGPAFGTGGAAGSGPAFSMGSSSRPQGNRRRFVRAKRMLR